MNDFILLLIGGFLTIIGGAISNTIHSHLEQGRELKAIKSALADELSGMEATIKLMHEVWEVSHVLYASHLADLAANTKAFDAFYLRLFLIKDTAFRKEMVVFYKKVRDMVRKNEGKVGSLADTTEARAEQTAIEAAFSALAVEAKNIRSKLEV